MVSSTDCVGRLSEAEAALSKSEKLLSELSGMPLVLHDDIEGWTIKLCLAIGRCVSTIMHVVFRPNVFIRCSVLYYFFLFHFSTKISTHFLGNFDAMCRMVTVYGR